MTRDLVSSAPGIFQAFLSLINTAAAAQSPIVTVRPFELGQYEPASYVLLHSIENHIFEPRDVTFGQLEHYDVLGSVVVFTGTGIADNPTVTSTVMNSAYSIFQACVMTPFVENATAMPILNTTGPSPYQGLPGFARYTASVGQSAAGEPWGWEGSLAFSFHFDGYVGVTSS